MNLIKAPTNNDLDNWFTQQHITLTFSTDNGNSYTLVTRPKVTILVEDNTGKAWRGNYIRITTPGCVELRTKNGLLFRTTRVTSFYVATN